MSATSPEEEDAVLAALMVEASSTPDTVGLVLTGSRSVGRADVDSDYDVLWVLTDAEFERRLQSGAPLSAKQQRRLGATVDILFTCQRRLALPIQPAWQTFMYASGRVLVDKTGAIGPALRGLATIPEAQARADVAGWFDAFLNAFYRSLKAWRRDDELAGRVSAVDMVQHVIRLLFSLERRWPPYPDYLSVLLPTLPPNDWPPEYLQRTLLELVRAGAPSLQQELERRVEHLLRQRGFETEVDRCLAGWGGEIQRVRRLVFTAPKVDHRGLYPDVDAPEPVTAP